MHILSGIGVNWVALRPDWSARHRAATEIRQLYQFDDRELRDVGLSRCDFPAIMRGTYRRG